MISTQAENVYPRYLSASIRSKLESTTAVIFNSQPQPQAQQPNDNIVIQISISNKISMTKRTDTANPN